MSIEENKAIARRFVQVWGKGDLGVIDELASPSLSVYYPSFPQAIKGGEAFKTLLKEFRSAFTDSNLDTEEEIAEGDKVVTRYTSRGTHKGEFMGIPATGKEVVSTGIVISRIAEGKIAEDWEEFDGIGYLQQLGVIPPIEEPDNK